MSLTGLEPSDLSSELVVIEEDLFLLLVDDVREFMPGMSNDFCLRCVWEP